MNTRNDWEATLQMANEDLKQYGMEIIVRPDGPGVEVDDAYYSVFIKEGDKEEEIFADNYYEHELGEVVNEAWAHARVKAKAKQQTVYVVTFLNDCEWELPNVSVNVFGTEEEARKCLDEEWQTLTASKEYDEVVSIKNDDDFLFEDHCANRTYGEIKEKEVK